MSYIKDSLSDGEEVSNLFKFHWVQWLMFWIWILLGVPTVGLGWIVALWYLIKIKTTEMGVTNKRAILKTGFISRNTEEMRLSSIETVEIDQSIFGRLLGYGSVKITGRGFSDVKFVSVDKPLEVKKKIESISNPV